MREHERTRPHSLGVREDINTLLRNPSIEPRIASAVTEIINELREDQPDRITKFELVIYTLLKQPDQPTLMNELTPFFEGSPDPRQAVRNTLNRLNDKLKQQGARVEHISAYRLNSR